MKMEKQNEMPTQGTTTAERVAHKLRKKRQLLFNNQKDDKPPHKENLSPQEKLIKEWKGLQKIALLQPSELTAELRYRIIYDDGDLIAIDKPYGLPVHGGPKVTNSINSLLPNLGKKVQNSGNVTKGGLHLIHRLDKETTGVMLLARSEAKARQLNQMFLHRKIEKMYWVVTVGAPELTEGIIDIPIINKEVSGKNRMVLKPDIKKEYSHVLGNLASSNTSQSFVAVTHFRVLSKSDCGAALIELKPETGVKHQLRVHMAEGLDCNILGDHKYSHYDKLAPQRLQRSLLRKFDVEQPKVRYLPMHLHAKQLIIPEFRNGRDLRITAKLPNFFVKTLKKLALRIPK